MDLLSAPTPTRDTVLLSFPASSAYLSIVRTATAGLAARLAFTVDEIEDLRIAVDEACAMLLATHPEADVTPVGLPLGEDTTLSCLFALYEDGVSVDVSINSIGTLPAQDTFAWQVLAALADDVDVAIHDTQPHIYLYKKRGSP